MIPRNCGQEDRQARTGAIGAEPSGAAEFEATALPYLNDLYRAAASILHSRAEAEDAVQEAYLQALKSFHRKAWHPCRLRSAASLFYFLSRLRKQR